MSYLSDELQAHWLKSCGDATYDKIFDLNKDKIIDLSDFNLLKANIQDEDWCAAAKADTTDPCVVASTAFDNIANQLASISTAIAKLFETLK